MHTTTLTKFLNATISNSKTTKNNVTRVFREQFHCKKGWSIKFFAFIFRDELILRLKTNEQFTEQEVLQLVKKNVTEESVTNFIKTKYKKIKTRSGQGEVRGFTKYINTHFFPLKRFYIKHEQVDQSIITKLTRIFRAEKVVWNERNGYCPSTLF